VIKLQKKEVKLHEIIRDKDSLLEYVCPKCVGYETLCQPYDRLMLYCENAVIGKMTPTDVHGGIDWLDYSDSIEKCHDKREYSEIRELARKNNSSLLPAVIRTLYGDEKVDGLVETSMIIAEKNARTVGNKIKFDLRSDDFKKIFNELGLNGQLFYYESAVIEEIRKYSPKFSLGLGIIEDILCTAARVFENDLEEYFNRFVINWNSKSTK
jgi:hypothetical protein